MSASEIDRARERTVRARADLTDALAALKERLLPRTIARNLAQATKEKAVDAAEAGADAVRTHPGIAIGATALAALFLARKPIGRAISSPPPETRPHPARSPAEPPRKGKP